MGGILNHKITSFQSYHVILITKYDVLNKKNRILSLTSVFKEDCGLFKG